MDNLLLFVVVAWFIFIFAGQFLKQVKKQIPQEDKAPRTWEDMEREYGIHIERGESVLQEEQARLQEVEQEAVHRQSRGEAQAHRDTRDQVKIQTEYASVSVDSNALNNPQKITADATVVSYAVKTNSADMTGKKVVSSVETKPLQAGPHAAREGMKWAIILGKPKSMQNRKYTMR